MLDIGDPVECHKLILYAVGFVRTGRPSDWPAETAITRSANRYVTGNKAWQPHMRYSLPRACAGVRYGDVLVARLSAPRV